MGKDLEQVQSKDDGCNNQPSVSNEDENIPARIWLDVILS